MKLIYADGTSTVQQKSGYTSKKAAEQARTEIIGQLYANAYVVYENILLEEFLEFWLEDVMRPKMKNSSYVSYRNSIHRHINPHLGKVKLTKLNRGHIQQLYNKEMIVSESAVKQVKTVMNTAMGYALEKNRRRRINDKHNPFFDGNYVCCSTYGKPRSKDFHRVHFKKLLKENDLPDIRWHDLRATYCTILLKNDFNPKALSKLMGHAKEIITIDVYGDNREIIEDCLENLEPFMMKCFQRKK